MAILSGAGRCQRAMVARLKRPSRTFLLRLLAVFLLLLGAGISMGQSQALGPLRGDQAEAFNDGKTLVVFAYQNDELLWMEPFLSVARKIIVAGYPPSATHRAAVAKMPSQYQEAWTPALGQTEAGGPWLCQGLAGLPVFLGLDQSRYP